MNETPGNREYVVSKDVLTAHLEGEAVLLHLKTKRYFRLNETGAVVWKGLEGGLSLGAIVAQLVKDFDVDAVTARAEVERVLGELRERELLAS